MEVFLYECFGYKFKSEKKRKFGCTLRPIYTRCTGVGSPYRKIRLDEMNISPCRACNACVKSHKCVINDDLAAIAEKMLAADMIVLATPVYFYSLCAQLKILIDRCYARHIEMKNKKFVFIITAADPQRKAANETLDSLRGFIRCLPDAEEKAVIYGTGTWDKGDVFKHPSYDEAYKLGKEI